MPDIAKIRKAFERLCAGEDDTGCSGGLTVINKCDLEILGGELFAEPQGWNSVDTSVTPEPGLADHVAEAVNHLLGKWDAESKIEKLLGCEVDMATDIEYFAVGCDGPVTAENVSELVSNIKKLAAE